MALLLVSQLIRKLPLFLLFFNEVYFSCYLILYIIPQLKGHATKERGGSVKLHVFYFYKHVAIIIIGIKEQSHLV